MNDRIYYECSKRGNYLKLTITDFIKEVKKKFGAAEADTKEQYIKELCAKMIRPIALIILKEDIINYLLSDKEKLFCHDEESRNTKENGLETYYSIMTGKTLVIIIEIYNRSLDYNFRVIGNSTRLLDELIIIKGISESDALAMNGSYMSYISANIRCGYIKAT